MSAKSENSMTPNPLNSPSRPSLKNMNILVVDDSVCVLKLTTITLGRAGHTVTKAENGQECLDILAKNKNENIKRFDVILLDIFMPVLDGLETLKIIRKNEKNDSGLNRQIIVICSACGDEGTSKMLFDFGCDAFLSKPFQINAFYETCRALGFRD